MLDFEYAKALAEVVLDTTCSEKEREVRLECSTQIFGRANAYLKKGFLPDVVEAFFVRKMKGLPLVSTKQDMQDFLKVSTPHYFGGKFTGRRTATLVRNITSWSIDYSRIRTLYGTV